MPSIDVAMARSVRPSAVEAVKNVLARSIAAGLVKRGIVTETQDKVSDIKTALSSWDNCMDYTWCK